MSPAVAPRQLLQFAVGAERLAMPADEVTEVVLPPPTTRLPHAPAGLRGLANVRGQVVPVLSMATLLGRSAGTETRLVMLGGVKPVGLLVDGVSALVNSDATSSVVEPRPLIEKLFANLARPQAKSSTAREAGPVEKAEARPAVTLLSFLIAGQEFALPIAEVREVLRAPDHIAVLPQGGEAIVGTASHRGGLVPLLDLRTLLGLGVREAGGQPRVLLTRVGAYLVGLLVDSVSAVLHVDEDLIDPLPTVLARRSGETRIQAICRMEGGRRLVSVLSSDRLLTTDIAAQLPEETNSKMIVPSEARADEQILLFRLGADEFGMPVSAVREVTLRPERLTSLPRAPAFVDGVMNLRGQVVPVIDQRRRFGIPHADAARKPVLVVALGASLAGFVVDAVTRVASVDADALQPAPDLGMGDASVIDRVATLDIGGRLVLLVDPQELLDRAERDLLAAMESGAEAPQQP